jgi:hypothetical protein
LAKNTTDDSPVQQFPDVVPDAAIAAISAAVIILGILNLSIEINMALRARRRLIRNQNYTTHLMQTEMKVLSPVAISTLGVIGAAQILQRATAESFTNNLLITSPSNLGGTLTGTVNELVNPATNKAFIPITANNSEPNSANLQFTLQNLQGKIFGIIDAVTAKISMETILNMATNLQKEAASYEEVFKILHIMEDSLLGIFSNIIDRVDLQVILRRINYIRDLLAKIGELNTELAYHYDPAITNMVYDIIKSFVDKIDFSTIFKQVQIFYDTIKKHLANIGFIEQVEDLTLSVLKNISDGVELNIVTKRIEFIQETILQVDENYICYNTNLAENLLRIVDLLINKVPFSDIILEIKEIQTIINTNLRLVEVIKESEGIVMGIIENVAEGKELSIIRLRVLYLQELLSGVKIS